MTNYSAWDAKATALLREAEREDETDKAENNLALGLDDMPRGPPTVKAESELKCLSDHSNQRKEFIHWSQKREVSLNHQMQETPVFMTGHEFQNKAIRIHGSADVTYIVPERSRITKLMLDDCSCVRVQVLAPILTSTIEVCRCKNVDFELSVSVGTIQVDQCVAPVHFNFGEYDHIGRLYHENSPGLCLSWGSTTADLHHIGKSGDIQLCTRVERETLMTVVVQRGEGEFPIDISGDNHQMYSESQTDADNMAKSQAKRILGNEMFRANDFMQATMEYTSALELDPSIAAVWANRSQCWLKLGNHEKALADAEKCTEIDPASAKGWFRQGISLHAMKRYPDAIAPLLQAEKLDPNNKQICEAVKMAQLMARRHAGGA